MRDLEKRLAEALKREAEAQERQTATSEILTTIAHAQTDAQPVFDTIVRSAARLCHATNAAIFLTDGRMVYQPSNYGEGSPEALAVARARFPRPLNMESMPGMAILTRAVIHVPDIEDTSPIGLIVRETGRQLGFRSTVAVPMQRDGEAVGSIHVARPEPGRFADVEVALLKTFADQAVIAIESVRRFTELETRNTEMSETLARQMATAEVLRAISQAQADAQPVFEIIAASARRLCGAAYAQVQLYDGELIHLAALESANPEGDDAIRAVYPLRVGDGSAGGRAIATCAVTQIPDLLDDRAYAFTSVWQASGLRSLLAVPMMREGAPVGVIGIGRTEPGMFPRAQIDLLQIFADQAVIAIENVRLFNETKEALEQQTATADILRVISRSPTDLMSVFDVILANACRLCEANLAGLWRVSGNHLVGIASYNASPEFAAHMRSTPLVPSRHGPTRLAALERRTVHVADMTMEPGFSPVSLHFEKARTVLSVPLLHDAVLVGVLTMWRREVRPFSEQQIALVQTFADQAVIAIENVRLFTELESRNRDLTVSLEQQTVTSEILRVISQSQTAVQPVFETIIQSAVRLCAGLFGALYRFDGELIYSVARHNYTPEALEEVQRVYPTRATRALGSGRAILDRAVIHIPDVERDPEFQHLVLARATGWRSGLFVPMLREGMAIGAIAVLRAEAGPFSDSEIELLKTFADQAVIAIENVRLFTELQARTQELSRSVGELQALGEVGQAISSTLDLRTVLSTIVARATQLSDTDAGVIYEYDEQREVFVPRASEHLETEIVETMLATPVRKGEGATGRLAEIQEPIQVPDMLEAPAESRVRGALVRAGYRALLAVPLVREDHLLGGLTVIRKTTGEFAPEVIDLLRTFATQSALAMQNARLFREIEDKSRQLEAASQHKSEFLANMSHELRTPLNAIIGFSEVLRERMFGDVNEKQEEYLQDIHASGQHLLSLINDILDLSKIEAGRMELEVTEFDVPSSIDNALILVRERATRRGIALERAIDDHVDVIRGDERKVKQVLLNLLSNAIKFTPEGGRIDVRAAMNQGTVEISVADTGMGIAPEDQEAVFEEFRQVGTADKKVEGTGLGLALCRKFVELHGGKIWVTSRLGQGSTFTFTLPVHRGDAARSSANCLI